MLTARPRLFRGYLDSQLGRINLLFNTQGELIRLDLGLPEHFDPWPQYREATPDQQVATAACTQLGEYFEGTRRDFDLPIAPLGSAFLKEAWALLRRIPYGTTSTYGALAKAMSKPSSARAIGMANAVNPVSIIVPCHRVIAATGHLTGYSGGLDKKRSLLMLEAKYTRADLACGARWMNAPST